MLTITLKNLVAHRARLVSTALAVLLGVAFMAGTLVFTDTLSATFDDVVAEADDGVDAMVRAPSELDLGFAESGARIDASVADAVATVQGVEDAAVRVSGYAQLVGPDGQPVGDQSQTPAFGLNWVEIESLNPYRLVAGTPPRSDEEIVIDRASASTTGYEVGDTATVLTSQEPRRFTISGIATFGRADSAAGARAVLFTDDVATGLLATPGQVDGVAVEAATGVSQTELVASLREALPDELEVISGDTLVEEDQAGIAEDLSMFRVFMLVFAFIAVFVGAFIINNTFAISVAQRTREMAMLRAVGASRRQVLRAVLMEAAVIGTVASGVGLAVGIAVAQALEAMIGWFGFELPDGPTVINPRSMLIALAVGVVVTVASAWLPARRAGRIRPIAALREVAVSQTTVSVARTARAVLVALAGIALLLLGLDGAGISLVGLGALVTLMGVAMLGPVLIGPLGSVIGAPMRLCGVPGAMAVQNVKRNPKRTARTASALMIGVALIAFISIFASSVNTSFAGAVETDYRGTHVIDSGVWDSSGGFSPELADALRADPAVRTVSETRITPAVVGGVERDQLSGFDAAAIGELFDLGTVDGNLADLGSDGIAVASDRAEDEGWTLGSTIAVVLPSGSVDLVVRAIYEDSLWVGEEFVDVAAFDAHFPGHLDTRIYVDGDDAAIRATAAPYPTAEVLDRQGFVDLVADDIGQILGFVYAMLAFAVVIALFGITNTLALSTYERTRELGLLRAVGMARAQVRATVRGEAVVIALFGAVTGLAVGAFFAWATVHALADYGIESFTLPASRLALIAVLAGVAGVAAASLPARRAARMNMLEALSAR